MSLRILRAITWLLSAALVLAAYAPGQFIAARAPAQITDAVDVVVDGQVTTGAAGSGAPAKLQFFVANNGTITATNVVLTVTLPAHVFVVAELSSAGWNCANSKCTYAVGSLAPVPGTPITSASSATLYVNIPPDAPNAGDFLPYRWFIADDGASRL